LTRVLQRRLMPSAPLDKKPDKRQPSRLDDALKGLDKVGGIN
jgi:hypothetical protein